MQFEPAVSTEEVLASLADFPPFLTRAQLREVSSLSDSTIARDLRDGRLRFLRTKPGRGGRHLFRKEDVAAWLSAMSF